MTIATKYSKSKNILLKIAKDKKILDRALEVKIEDNVYNEIEEIIKNQ